MIETLWKWIGVSALTCIEFFLFSGVIFFVFYVWNNKKLWYAKIQQRYPDNKQIGREIIYSVYSLFIAGGFLLLLTWAGKHGLTMMYKPIDKYGWFYYCISPVLMIIVHDTYFYWTHRLLHWKKIFKYVHLTHHLSTNPTPFSAYAFHPVEGFLQLAILPIIAFTIPYHITAITIFSIYSTAMNVFGHAGFEFFPKKFANHKILKWHNAVTHHNMHHRYFNTNYGLYFNFWDRILKTNHPNYETYHEKVVDERAERKLTLKTGAIQPIKAKTANKEFTDV